MIEILEYISIVAPGAVSVLGIIIGLFAGGMKLKNIIDEFKTDKDRLVAALKASDSDYKKKVDELIAQNKELARVNSILVDQIAKIKGYCDGKNKTV